LTFIGRIVKIKAAAASNQVWTAYTNPFTGSPPPTVPIPDAQVPVVRVQANARQKILRVFHPWFLSS